MTSTQLIITQVVAYYDRCCAWYGALVKRPQSQTQGEGRQLKTAAAMVDSGQIKNLAESVWRKENLGNQEDSIQKEIKMLIAKTNETPLDPFDIISDPRSVKALSLLYSSMQWLTTQLHQLRRVVPDKHRAHNESIHKAHHKRQWSLLDSNRLQDNNSPVYLPMTQETVEAFDSILDSIGSLGMTALLTLHIAIRLGIIHMLTRTLHAPYLLAQPARDPDQSVLSLNEDLLSFADTLTTHLPSAAQNFITGGLAQLIDTVLVTNASHITSGMNEHGCGRMQLNILVLSQNLKSIETSPQDHTVELERSARFYDLFMEGADSIVGRARDKGGEGLEGFDLEELKALVELWYREGTESGAREVQVKSRRELGDKLLVLSECLWNR